MYAQLEDAGLICGTDEWKDRQDEEITELLRENYGKKGGTTDGIQNLSILQCTFRP